MPRQRARWAGRAAAVLVLAGAGTVLSQQRPLPEVAKERPDKPAARVFTNEDLEAVRPAEASLPDAAAPAAPPADSGTAQITVPGLVEKGTLSQARAVLQSLQRDEEVLLRRYAQIQEKLSTETDSHLRRLYSESLARRDQTLARKRKQIEAVAGAIEHAEQDRRAGQRKEHEVESGVTK